MANRHCGDGSTLDIKVSSRNQSPIYASPNFSQ